eukprot:TRINITY_DN9581_c0_g2_i1.p1 TRINITY_DN9581_c0_g2~~TRINITY_DN9581_c0_g2_i1.p1  ORF type:complete len:171 (+),score=31.83 TRINITY_DN9581_c0_g2_i1:29-514(+)
MDGRMNSTKDLIGFCYRGEIDSVKNLLETLKTNDTLSQGLNTKRFYRGWFYFGNYSATHAACIKFENKKKTETIYIPSIETNHSRRPAKLPESRGGSPLHWSAMSGQLEVVKLLCESGADVSLTVSDYNATAEDIARANGFINVAKYLKWWANKQGIVSPK